MVTKLRLRQDVVVAIHNEQIADHEIDLIFEINGSLHACEIKATERPGPKDFRNLKNFKDRQNRPIKRYLFYLGDQYKAQDNITLIPIAALCQGK
jgi:hypothetical protein